MHITKPLLWLLEPYIVYKAYLWGLRFYSHPVTWEGEPDWFSLTLTTLLAIDAIVLPLLLLYLPACNPDKNVPRWIIKIVNPLDRFVAWVESKQLGAVWMKIIGALWAFFIYLVPVYIGGQSYSLRSRASNFTMEDIKEACEFARQHNAHIHVTTNVIPHEEDYEGLREYLMKLEEYGVTAIIAASPSIMKLARECAPKLEIHCSTQMSITNVETAKFLHEQLGLDRAVLARECSIEDIYAITKECPVDTEAFIHGGMCVNYSGRCTLSNRMTLRDANRGGCAQSCRWQYHVYQDDKELNTDILYSMGSKDLLAADYMYELMDAGVSSLKIEGRMKTEYYVASVVSAYRHLIDEIAENDGPLSPERLAYHKKEISRAENRQTTTAFYPGEAGLNTLIYHAYSDADVNHDFLAKVAGYDQDANVAYLETRNAFDVGEMLEVISPGKDKRTFKVEWIKDPKGEYLASSRRPMVVVQVPIPFEIGENDLVRRAR